MPEYIVLTLDMQADFIQEMRRKKLVYSDLTKRAPAVPVSVLFDWMTINNPSVLKADWELVCKYLAEAEARKVRRCSLPQELLTARPGSSIRKSLIEQHEKERKRSLHKALKRKRKKKDGQFAPTSY